MNPAVHATGDACGARFHKCALQVNPQHYAETFRGEASRGDSTAHAREIVAKALALGIEVLAITDHNSVSDVPAFRAAAANGPVHVLPGFELSSREGVHVLCIYSPDTSEDQLGRYLGEFGVRETAPSANLCDRSIGDLLKGVRDQGGVTIAAHATNDGGLLKVLSGQARIHAWRDENLLAMQIPGAIADLSPDFRRIVENLNADYRRGHAPERRQAVAVVNARDVVDPADLEHPAASCWIKMDQVGIEGLKQAFLDPGSRIRLTPWELQEHMELRELRWTGGFLDGERIRLNSNLNVLIGGRGSGKSTVIESLRSVLGISPVGDDARGTHEGIVRRVLRSGTKISLTVGVQRPAPREYRIERTIPNPPLVREPSGEVSHLAPTDLLPRVEIFGQHEISEIARRPEKLTRLLDRFVQVDETLEGRKASLLRELEKNRQSLTSLRGDIASAEETLADLPALNETLQRFQEVGLEERLHDQTLLVREEQVIDSAPRRLAPFREALDTLSRELPLDRAFLSEAALAELPARDVLAKANQVLLALERDVERTSRDLREALERADEGLAETRAAWEVGKRDVEKAYARILRSLHRSKMDGEEFIRLRRRIERLRPLTERLSRLRNLQEEELKRRRSLLAEWEEARGMEFRALDQAARKASRALDGHARIDVASNGDREPLFIILRELGGRMSETIDRLATASDLSLRELADACRSGSDALQRRYQLTPAQAARLAQATPDVHMRLEELDLAPTTAIHLNTAQADEPPDWKPLDDLSTGQKATAVLLLLLLESDAPLIVDQPEDDLDNRFVTEVVVPRMREAKQRRQFIFSTHNANIPVLGDAELILGLSPAGEAGGGHSRIAQNHRGSIDSTSVRELVEELLEGGKAAFETRRRKYGF